MLPIFSGRPLQTVRLRTSGSGNRAGNNRAHSESGNFKGEKMKRVFMWLFTSNLIMIANVARAWEYEQSVDAMSSKQILFATTKSTNSLNLEFPYKGQNNGTLQIRQHPKWGLSVIFSIDKGQIQCHSYSGCPIEIRFDQQTSMKFSGNESADSSSDTVFIKNPCWLKQAGK